MADIIQAQIIDEEIVTPSADPVAHNMPGGGAVESVNGRTGAVVLTADDVGAVAAETFNTAMQGKQDKLTAGAGAEIKDGVLSATSLGITGAAVGQIGRITAVDSEGKPTAWEPVDMPSGGGGEIVANETIIASGTIASDLAAWKSFFAGELTVRELRNWKRFLFVAKPGTATVVNVSVSLGGASYSVYTGNRNATTHYVLFEWLDSDRTVLDAWAVLGDSAIAIRDDTGYFINLGENVNPVMGSTAPCRILQQRVLDSQFDNATLRCFVNTAQTAAGAWTLHGLLK